MRERVHVSTMEASSGDDLYSVFSLEYKVDPPCNAIITPRHMAKYKRIFNFLWGLKRVEQALSTSWRCIIVDVSILPFRSFGIIGGRSISFACLLTPALARSLLRVFSLRNHIATDAIKSLSN